MEISTYVALSRLIVQQRAVDVTAENLANMSTPGFKASRVLSTDWLSDQVGTDAPPGETNVAYTQDRATYRDAQSGAVTHTANQLDLAIAGAGYFTVMTPNGPRLTRAGHFTALADGTVGDMDGNKLLNNTGQPINLNPNDANITITADGSVSSESGTIATIGVVAPNDPNKLTAEGNRLLRADTPTTPVATPKLVQGAVEDSNVQPILETTRMLDDVRSFQFMSQFVESESQRMQTAIEKITQRNA